MIRYITGSIGNPPDHIKARELRDDLLRKIQALGEMLITDIQNADEGTVNGLMKLSGVALNNIYILECMRILNGIIQRINGILEEGV